MDAVGSARQRDVEPIVDDDARGPCRVAMASSSATSDGQRTSFEIALPDLDQIDAGVRPHARTCAVRQSRRARRGAGGDQAPPIRDQADHRVSSCGEIASRIARAANKQREIGEAGKQVDDAQAR